MSTRVPTAAVFQKKTSHAQRISRTSEMGAAHIRWDRLALFVFCAAVHLAWISAVVAVFR